MKIETKKTESIFLATYWKQNLYSWLLTESYHKDSSDLDFILFFFPSKSGKIWVIFFLMKNKSFVQVEKLRSLF